MNVFIYAYSDSLTFLYSFKLLRLQQKIAEKADDRLPGKRFLSILHHRRQQMISESRIEQDQLSMFICRFR